MSALLLEPVEQVDGPVVLVCYGKPITQGSKTRNRYGGVRDDNASTLKPWREAVKTAALEAMVGRERILGPVDVDATFYFDRPAAHYGTGRNAAKLKESAPRFPMSKGKDGDGDKLLRAVFDSLTDAGVFKDDVLVVDFAGRKRWAGGQGGLRIPGVVLEVRPL